MTKEINEENIRVAAYYIWEQAGRPEGKDKECWIKACEQLFAPKKTVAVAAKKKPAAKKVAPKAVAKKAEPVKKPAVKAPAKPAAKKPVAPKKPAPKAPVKTKAAPFYGSRK